ncbi:Bacterial sugar transferase [hydrothermal vent metagenome]|uniref:Bacterial sugar transferase n=1 Tax=hydrothermal vent metagenome TaxID=652676 RepID=A0A1W1C0S3_9ZZZZ
MRIKGILKSANSKLIVLNTKIALPSKLLTYLTKLEIKGIRYMTVENFVEEYLHKCLIIDESFNIAFLDNIHSYSIAQKIQKKVIDYIAIIMLLIPTLLAIIYSAYRVRKESPGTLFFRQKRVGLGECEFTCVKLRSMHLDAEKDGAKFATDNDPRAFPWGEKLRKSKIDELIQLWNVFKGEMHFVGPRPERKIWTKEFEKSIPYYTQRHIVKPGITGLAQIKYQYGSGKLDAKEKLMYDLYYIKNWNIFLELKIIWETLLFVLTRKRDDLSNF